VADNTMIERVSRALCTAAGIDPQYWSNPLKLFQARAALDAIKLLTPSMLRAGLTAMSRDDLEPTEAEFAAGYTAAIRDALGETFGKGDGE
jgi:hypothetical protein